MSLIVEDGTGIENANSFVDVVYADDYFSTRGVADWALLTQEQKEVFLIKATDYINNGFKWYGQKLTTTQSLKFPRKNLVDEDGEPVNGVPTAIKDATCECAYLIKGGAEMFRVSESNGAVTSERIGELAFTYDTSKSAKKEDCSLYDSINQRLRGLYVDMSKNCIVSGKVERA